MLLQLMQGFVYLILFIFACRFVNRIRRCRRSQRVIAFFHPYCNSLGGGERVLWTALSAMHARYSDCDFVVYTGDNDVSDKEILDRAEERFGCTLQRGKVGFVRLRGRGLIEASRYPVCTLLGQSIGGFILGVEALCRLSPNVFVDTTGVPFTLPLFRFVGACHTAAYVHYPTISMDMLDLVQRRDATYNNNPSVAASPFRSKLKLIYYRLFALLYRFAGLGCELTMVNSSWTYGHISKLWKCSPYKVYPPCDVGSFLKLDNEAEDLLEKEHKVNILSVGQFRPEKDHKKQLRALKLLRQLLKDGDYLKCSQNQLKLELILMGGCRNEEDMKRVEELKEYADQLQVADCVTWSLNAPFDQLLNQSKKSLIYLHTMWNEHFGIGVVEGQASGCIVLAHNSGGPRLDILVEVDDQSVGLLASSDIQFAQCMCHIITQMDRGSRQDIRDAARQSAQLFSQHSFAQTWINAFDTLLA